jgi:hypothetical protein
MSFQVRKSFKTKTIEMYRRERKCLHHYVYLMDPEFGFMHIRIQEWIPYDCRVYINGREWLARRLDEAGIGYLRYDNSLLRVDDLHAAAQLCDQFAHRAWPRVLNAFARMVNPIAPAVRAAGYGGYYWVLDQAEIATDIMFKCRRDLLDIWPDLVHHAALNLGSEDVLGFLGRKLHPSLTTQVVTDTKRRPEGWRVQGADRSGRHLIVGPRVERVLVQKGLAGAGSQSGRTTVHRPGNSHALSGHGDVPHRDMSPVDRG